jgi:uncharacterized protein YhbP (UPF0306 family)
MTLLCRIYCAALYYVFNHKALRLWTPPEWEGWQ